MVIIARSVFHAEVLLSRLMRKVGSRLESWGKEIAEANGEVGFLIKKHIETQRPLVVGGEMVQTIATAWYPPGGGR